MKWEEIPEVDLFSDGGAEPNPGKGGFGVILSYKGQKKEFSQGFQLTTNNRMELLGVITGLEQLKTKSLVNVFTDSRYVIDGIEKGWASKWRSNNWIRAKNKLASNHHLWGRLLTLIEQHQEVKFNWVKGHAGHLENERCDELAGIALNGQELLEDSGYLPEQKLTTSNNPGDNQSYSKNKSKIEQEGDLCRKCGTAVLKRQPKKRKVKQNQSYYYEYYLMCPQCRTLYMVEEAKRNIENNSSSLFD